MLDFLKISTKSKKMGQIEIYPKFIIKKGSDLMIRGGDFYACWIEEKGLWSIDEQECLEIIDRELDKYAEEHRQDLEGYVTISHMWDAETGMIDRWHKFCQQQMRDDFHNLDEKLIFANSKIKKKDYASKTLPYALEQGGCDAYDELMSTLYSEDERKKIEWAIGSVVNGDSKKIQKFLVLYGAAGTGKSTVLNIIQMLFDGYFSVFDAKALGAANNAFALEAFQSNPLVAIQHDGDLSRIEDNTKLNSLVSHETMMVNAKFKRLYPMHFISMLFMGTNKPVKITDAKSGILRRLIDVSPSGDKIPTDRYFDLMDRIPYELGAIAWKCKGVYESNKRFYDTYIPTSMMGATNDFYDFMVDSYHIFKRDDGTTLMQAWTLYKTYCEQANVAYPMNRRAFGEELKNYFKHFEERAILVDGTRVRNYYTCFKSKIFDYESPKKKENGEKKSWLIFDGTESELDKVLADCPAQYANEDEKPTSKWVNVKTKLSDLDTHKLHYVRPPANLVTVDFDIPGDDGKKSFERNLAAASQWYPTYAETSKSGAGIHLEYLYSGDVSKLAKIAGDHIEIKVMTGNASLRRMLTKCNSLPVATISSGLPLKEEKEKMYDSEKVKSEKNLRRLIERNLAKEIHPGTKPSMDFIYKILEDAYNDGLKYDLRDMRPYIMGFAANSTHQSEYCLKLANQMHYCSKEYENEDIFSEEEIQGLELTTPIVFFDVEVFPNLFVICWKIQGSKDVVRMINPKASEVEQLMKYRLVGFNNRKYDNHILWAAMMGYGPKELYKLSQRIISGDRTAMFREAYSISYTDIYDFSSKKQSLKKFEIELGIHHQELGLPWDKEVPEELWDKVAEYCCNDVIATEATFDARQADFIARQVLAEVAGGSVNDTTNSLTTKIIFGNNRKPQNRFNYRFMGDCSDFDANLTIQRIKEFGLDGMVDPEWTKFDSKGNPMFPGYEFIPKKGNTPAQSLYRGEEVGLGGYVYAKPGIHTDDALLDIASMHPTSIIDEDLFGDEYTKRFSDIKDTRLLIKHGELDKAKEMLDGALAKFLDDTSMAKNLAQALKIVINAVYGQTMATYDCPFRDPRNIDNIVAKRGALFMVNLKHEVEAKGFKVAHIKTDSIKIPNATPEIIDFVMRYGKLYGYNFEHEATYDRMCLVNDAVYIAKYADGNHEFEIPATGEKIMTPWTATGKQFQVPYLFKNLFSRTPIKFDDLCETRSVKEGDIYIDMNEDLPPVEEAEKELAKLEEKYRKGKISDILFEESCKGLIEEIAAGHNYIFVGRVGRFCPIKDGCGGGKLYRVQDGKYYAVAGTSDYRWLEAELVQNLGKEADIDESYYISLCNDAVAAINKYGDFDKFVSDEPYICEPVEDFMNVPDGIDDEVPFE